MKAPWWENRTMWLWLTGSVGGLNLLAGLTSGGPMNLVGAAGCAFAFYLWWIMRPL